MFNHINKVYALKKLEPIILLSHMRANTSLFGHILGNNPAINGYYEMHIGYYSWKSLVRQKLIYLENHKIKKKSRYIFDKVLHNEHFINCNLVKDKAKIIFSLREPKETIPSIINLFEKSNPSHEYTTINGAIEYYTNRLKQLEQYSFILKGNYIYLDANCIKTNTNELFLFLEKELSLSSPLSAEYEIQKMTGLTKSGDSSKTLKQGKLIKERNIYSNITIENDKIIELNTFYNQIRNTIIKNSKSHLSLPS